MPQSNRRFDVTGVAHRQHLTAHHPGVARRCAQPGGNNQRPDAAAEHRHKQQRQHQAREREQYFQQPANPTVKSCTAKPAEQPQGNRNAHGQHGGRQTNQQRLAGAVNHPRKNIPAGLIRAEPMRPSRRMKRIVRHNRQRVGMGKELRQQRGNDQKRQKNQRQQRPQRHLA